MGAIIVTMRLASILLFLATPLFASRSLTANPPGGSPAGGQLVHLLSNGDVYFSSPSSVMFGTVPGTIVRVVWWNDLLVIAPPHDPGYVDVTVTQDGQQYSTMAPFSYGATEQVLVPVAVDLLTGANGTRWTTEIFVHNDADHAVPLDPEYCSFIGRPYPCPGPITRVAAKSTMRISGRGSSQWPYTRFYVPVQDADALHVSILVRELSTGQATAVAAVRDRDLRSGRIVLPGIANDGRTRATLRLYGRAIETIVSVADAATGEVLTSRTIFRYAPTDSDPFSMEMIQGLFDAPELRGHERLDVIVEPQPDDRHWALLTLTDNKTQQVVTITP